MDLQIPIRMFWWSKRAFPQAARRKGRLPDDDKRFPVFYMTRPKDGPLRKACPQGGPPSGRPNALGRREGLMRKVR